MEIDIRPVFLFGVIVGALSTAEAAGTLGCGASVTPSASVVVTDEGKLKADLCLEIIAREHPEQLSSVGLALASAPASSSSAATSSTAIPSAAPSSSGEFRHAH